MDQVRSTRWARSTGRARNTGWAVSLVVLLAAAGQISTGVSVGRAAWDPCAEPEKAWPSFRALRPPEGVIKLDFRMGNHTNVRGNQSVDQPCIVRKPPAAPRRYANLGGIHLTIGAMKWPTLLSYNSTSGLYSGFCWDLLQELTSELNFSFSLVFPADGQWGGFVNGSWTGLVQMIVKQEVDLVTGPLSVTAERREVMEWSRPVRQFRWQMWLVDPLLREEKWLVFVDLMEPAVSGLLVLAAVVVIIINTLATFVKSANGVTGGLFLRRLVNSSTGYVRILLLQAGSSDGPSSWAGRAVYVCLWWFSILLSITYTGTMVAVLSDSSVTYPFNTVRQLLRQHTYKYGFVGNSYSEIGIRDSLSSEHQELYAAIREFARTDPTVVSPDFYVHKKKVEQEKYVFIGDLLTSDRRFVNLREPVLTSWECLGLPINSSLTGPIDEVLKDLHQFGILIALWEKNGLTPRRSLPRETTRELGSPISLHLVKSTFYATFIGVGLSTLVLLAEIVARKCFFVVCDLPTEQRLRSKFKAQSRCFHDSGDDMLY